MAESETKKRDMRRIVLLSFMAIIMVMFIIIMLIYTSNRANHALMLDEKAMVVADYIGCPDREIIGRDGGYNNETELYEYHFVWFPPRGEKYYISYADKQDLTVSTAQRLQGTHTPPALQE